MINRKPTQVPDSLKTVDVKALLRKRGIYLKQKVNQEMKAAALPIARKMLTKPKQKAETTTLISHQFTNEQVQEYCEKQIRIVHVAEDKFNNKVKQFITKIVDGFLAHLESEVATNKGLKKFKAKDFFDDSEDGYLAQAQIDFTPLLANIATISGQRALDLIHSDDIYMVAEYRKRIADNVAKFTQSMLDTDQATLSKIIADGIEQGQSMGDIRNAIQADFDNITKSQADRITATEVSRVSIQGQLDAWQQSGLVEGKQWVIFGADDECADYDGQVESLDGNFYPDTTEFADGDPPLHPNCKCQVIPILLNEGD